MKMKKNYTQLKVMAIMLFTFNLHTVVNAQVIGTSTVVTQPCNNDGVLAVNITSGLTPPLTLNYYLGNTSVVHSNVNSLNDTLFGINPQGSLYTSQMYYSVSIYDVTGMQYFVQGTMTLPFLVDQAIVTNAICPALTGTAQITINGGNPAASVQWFQYAHPAPGAYVGTGNPMTFSPGEYSPLIMDGSGCSVFINDTAVSIQNISGITFLTPATAANCTNGTAAVTSITGGITPYTYLWNNGATTSSITGLSQGYYAVKVTDAQGCFSETNYIQVTQSINIGANTTPTPATCAQHDGHVITFGSGGTTPYTYLYDNGTANQTAAGLAGGTSVNVVVTDANGCTGNGYAYISSTTPITVTYSSTNSSCTAPTGSATLSINGGAGPYIVDWNTSPAQTGITMAGVSAGTYSFSVTDAVGCVQTGAAIVPQQSILNAYVSAANPVCPVSIGDVSVSATGSNPPFSYLWSTGATTSTISSVPVGFYTCEITDNVGCHLTKSSYLYNLSPVSISVATTNATCMYVADGTIHANAIGGTGPYTYHWSNGQSGATATGLTKGLYHVTVSDANGCSAWYNYISVGYDVNNTSCYCTLTGKVYVDANNNCTYDAGEQGVEHIMIHCSGFGYAFTDANGDYSFQVPSGTYTLSESVQYTYPLASCQNNAINVTVTATSGCTTTNDFANVINPLHDLNIFRTWINRPVPGNLYSQAMFVENAGTVSESTVQLGNRNDGQLNYVGSAYSQLNAAIEPNWYSVTSGFPTLAPGHWALSNTDYMVPTNIPLATVLNFWDTAVYAAPMNNWLTDYSPWNNVNAYQDVVIGSFDPNSKEVSPKGTGAQGFISTADSTLNYVVHFQNTGSYYAQKVVIMDTLDADLDWASLRPGYSDHPYTATISESGVLKFTFNNIHLDWQANNDMTSRGLISYSIKQKPDLAPLTTIKNSAAIYFDYNAPVITNQTLNTIESPTGITEQKSIDGVSVYPNPASSQLIVTIANAAKLNTILIYDVQGRLVQKEKAASNSSSQKINIADLISGFYFIVVEKIDGQKLTTKFVKN
jgi:hypothetical protein